ncbi:type II secretion system protein GspG, partial [Mycobacterium tuberculosis]|nr:type II secretion system protein GspG [Mycobacterium tuberculosis]
NEYQLLSPGQHGAIDVFSVGPDGMPDTNDEIGNWTLGEYLCLSAVSLSG